MAASVEIKRYYGATPASADITSINTRANATDAHTTADTTWPIQIPVGVGTENYSFAVTTGLNCTVTPTTKINNIKWYSDGANGFGTGVKCRGNDSPAYEVALGEGGVSGSELTTVNFASLTANGTDVFQWTSGAQKSIAGSIANPSTGKFGDYMLYQIGVASNAGPGATNQETLTWAYDES